MSEILKCILTLFSGCAVFMIGMHLLGEGLEKSAGSGMRRIFSKVDKNPVINVGAGALFTAIIQSSGATTVMVVGFVNAGVMSLLQAAYVIMGANLGTTITGVIVSFAAFDVMDYAAILAFIGMLLTFFKSETLKKIGQICAGFGFVFVGLSIMSGSFKEADELKLAFATLFENISFPLLLVVIGAVVTALMQSSSTMTGILIMLVANGAIPMASALYLVLGSNIGTCLTAFLASAGTTINAKRAAVIHLLFNVIGSIMFLIIIMCLEGPVTNLLNTLLPNQPGMQRVMVEHRGVTAFINVTVGPPLSTENSMEVSTDRQTEESAEASTEVPTEAPTEMPTETSAEMSTEASTEMPTEASTQISAEETTQVPAEESTEEPDTESVLANDLKMSLIAVVILILVCGIGLVIKRKVLSKER